MLILLKLEPEQALNLTDTVPLLDLWNQVSNSFYWSSEHWNESSSQARMVGPKACTATLGECFEAEPSMSDKAKRKRQ